jgi:hypothetical protein
MNFYENLSSGSRVVLGGQRERERDGQTDITKLTGAFANFSNAPKKQQDLIAGKEIHNECSVLDLASSFTAITSSKPGQKSL